MSIELFIINLGQPNINANTSMSSYSLTMTWNCRAHKFTIHRSNFMKYILFILILCTSNVYSQLKISDLKTIKVGSDLLQSRKDFDKRLNASGELRKLDRVSSVYKYSFENSIFNYCENTTYDFLYVNDLLADLTINMEYTYSKNKFEVAKFLESLETVLSSLNKDDAAMQLQTRYSDFNKQKLHKKINNADSILNNNSSLPDDISEVYSGRNVYFFQSTHDQRFLKMDVLVFYRKKYGAERTFLGDEIVLRIQFDLTTEKFQDYYEKFGWGTWSPINEKTDINLAFVNGVYHLPVNLNNVMTLDFTLDLGAADVLITPDVFLVLYRAGTISDSDFIGTQAYKFADGSTARSNVFNLKILKIGGLELKDVRASISNDISSPLLLGQSALKKLRVL
jgi:hypothetical protein